MAPSLAAPFVAVGLNDRLVAKIALVSIGLLGVAVTRPLNAESYGGWLLLVGGSLSLPAIRFGEWANQFDDEPKTV